MIENILGKNIRHYRLEHNWTQETLANILSISHQVISKWENGLTTPDIETLCTISKIFNVSLDELCGIAPKQVDILLEEIEAIHHAESRTYDVLCSKWGIIQQQLSLYPTNAAVLFSVLKFLRAMHDAVETEEQKTYTNTQILPIAERILDFSKDDSHRSFAHYNLALYYSEQVSLENTDEQNKAYANKAKSHADLVLYKDMHKTFYHSFAASNAQEEQRAREKTLVELLNATKQAIQNLLRHYSHHSSKNALASKELHATLSNFLEVLESIASKISFLHTTNCV